MYKSCFIFSQKYIDFIFKKLYNKNVYKYCGSLYSQTCRVHKEDTEMAEARFIKTVTFGGFDKNEVIRRLEYLNTQVFDLKNELRETKLLLDGYKKGTDSEKNSESVLAGERAKLTEVQVQNDTLTTKLKASEEDNRMYEAEIESLNKKIEELNDQLAAANSKLAAANAGDEALALSAVFIEAKKTADMLELSAKEKADKISAESKTAAEQTIAIANDEADSIINEAERKAAEIIAEAKNNASKMESASENLRASVLAKVKVVGTQLNDFRDALMKFEEQGVGKLYECEELLNTTENTLKEGGVPVFKEPEEFDPEYPDKPKKRFDPNKEEQEKRKSELDKLRQKAASIGKDNKSEQADTKPGEVKSDDAKKEEPQAENKSDENKKEEKKGKLDLAALAAQAQALNKK